MITIIGLGPGDAGLITRQAWHLLSAADTVYLRTGRHPAGTQLTISGTTTANNLSIPGCTLGSLMLDAGLQRSFSCTVTITGSVAANLMLP